ncbi:MAG: hypothetical protein GX434_00860 [Peptococcaceae bacterium]|nr:hypothetical protein [Peptococcaceae bacterium]
MEQRSVESAVDFALSCATVDGHGWPNVAMPWMARSDDIRYYPEVLRSSKINKRTASARGERVIAQIDNYLTNHQEKRIYSQYGK